MGLHEQCNAVHHPNPGRRLNMLDSLKPSHSPKRMWLAMVVVAGLGAVGVFVMLAA